MSDKIHAETTKVVVVGAGQAGFSVCAKLRSIGFKGQITLIGDEDHPPYQRPPLSKAYLTGDMALERLFFRPQSFYADENIELCLSDPVLSIDRFNKQIIRAEKPPLPYDKLVLATGSQPITLPDDMGGDLMGVHYVRTLKDTDTMRADVQPGKTALVIGGGYIGLEAAAVATKAGMKVVLVEAADRILQRVASPETARYFRSLHKAKGVDIREGVRLKALKGQKGRVTSAIMADGSEITTDCAIVGIGIRPNHDLAKAAGLKLDNGICVDAQCRTSDPDIFAVGDCASFQHGTARLRLESVGNAIDQGEIAARIIAGEKVSYQANPWFWSDQYDTKLQIMGLSTGYDCIVTRDSGEGVISFWYFAKDRLLAVDAINDPRAFMVAKRLIESEKSPDPALVSDPSLDLKQVLR
ncbi:NAD(P)/FAD-dependent oxidoreductase [Epibacterium ulvae]|uniref:NAD(P)/FAD-dependent oxidoreductase n=1 Tax=Epibacterium ulvae TaxID=1156985 RepID=UPI00249243AA|nr:FAD-dependent oxidoreductase [Epibacterium ulvae]